MPETTSTASSRDQPLDLTPGALEEVNRGIRSGTSWQEALQALLLPDRIEPLLPQLVDERVVNWIWLADPSGRNAALDLGHCLGTFAAGLSPHFANVVFHASGRTAAEFARLRFAQDGLHHATIVRATLLNYPYLAASFDCVAVPDLARHLALTGTNPAATLRRESAEWRRLLRPGGCLCVGFENAWWVGGHLTRRDRAVSPVRLPQRPSQLSRVLARAGFRTIRMYYADPTHSRPSAIVPTARHAVLAWERQNMAARPRSRILRTLAARFGLHALCFRSCILLAYP